MIESRQSLSRRRDRVGEHEMSYTPHKGTNRRTFLKAAGIAAGGIFALVRLLRTALGGESTAPAPPPAAPPLGRLSWTNRTRRIVFLARDEAARMGTNQVGPEHLCLALVSQYVNAEVKIP